MRDPAAILEELEPTLARAEQLSRQRTNEASTRLQVVDDILVALGWHKKDFNPETRTSLGKYTDYLPQISH